MHTEAASGASPPRCTGRDGSSPPKNLNPFKFSRKRHLQVGSWEESMNRERDQGGLKEFRLLCGGDSHQRNNTTAKRKLCLFDWKDAEARLIRIPRAGNRRLRPQPTPLHGNKLCQDRSACSLHVVYGHGQEGCLCRHIWRSARHFPPPGSCRRECCSCC